MATAQRIKQMYLGSAALARLPLYFEDEQGKLSPVGPLYSLGMLLEEQGEVSEQAIQTIADGFNDPTIVATALDKLGAIRVRKPNGEVVFTLGDDGGARSSDGRPVSSTDGIGRVVTHEGSASMALNMADSALDNYDRTGNLGVMVPLREATRKGMQVGTVTIVHKPDGSRWVYKSDLDAFLAKGTRANPLGAGTLIANKLTEAQGQRSSAHNAAVRARQASREYKDQMRASAQPMPGSTQGK